MLKPGKTIGIVGGMGPFSGLDLVAKIFANTKARRDSEHLPVILISVPESIPDRSAFLLGRETANPGLALAWIIRRLHLAGARVMGIPCHTSHAEPIFKLVRCEVAKLGKSVKLVNMLEETCRVLVEDGRGGGGVAVLSTLGVYQGRVYEGYLRRFGLQSFDFGLDLATQVHEVIYDIKSRPLPALRQARARLKKVILELKRRKVQRVVLGCTELPLALTEHEFAGVQLIDPTTILARALISQARLEKLIDRSAYSNAGR